MLEYKTLIIDTGDENEESVDDRSLELCAAALQYLHQCSGILASMYNMPACPVFHTAHRYYCIIYYIIYCYCQMCDYSILDEAGTFSSYQKFRQSGNIFWCIEVLINILLSTKKTILLIEIFMNTHVYFAHTCVLCNIL